MSARTTAYEVQEFEIARRFLTNHAPEGLFLLLKSTGLLRNDAEVTAFDAWEQSL